MEWCRHDPITNTILVVRYVNFKTHTPANGEILGGVMAPRLARVL